MSDFAERLSELVLYSDFTVSQLNQILHCGNSTLNHYLTGRHKPTVDMLVRVADYFNCTTDFLLGLEENSVAQSFNACPPFNERLNILCKEFSVSRYELQKRTKISESVMRYWARGKTKPSVDNLIKIANALECSVDFVLGREK